MGQWYMQSPGQPVVGPLDDKALLKRVKTGVPWNTKVREQGTQDWIDFWSTDMPVAVVKDRPVTSFIVAMTLASVILLGVGLIAHANRPSQAVSQPAAAATTTTKPKPAEMAEIAVEDTAPTPPPTARNKGIVRDTNLRMVFVFPSKDAIGRAAKAAGKNDRYGVAEEMSVATAVDNGTEVLVLGRNWTGDFAEVRVLSGPEAGRRGWVMASQVH